MSFKNFSDECWRDLPPIRKRIAGRASADKLLADAIREFEPEQADCNGYSQRLLDRVKARNETRDGEGFAILTFLLITIAAAVISWLVQRWLDNRFPKEQLESLRRELEA